MKINGIDGMTVEQVCAEVERGGKFVQYTYCVSVVFMTFKRGTDLYFIRPGENATVKGLPFTLLSLVVGWWGFPWGLIYTPAAVIGNLAGGRDLTGEVMASMIPVPAAVGYDVSSQPTPPPVMPQRTGPQNPW